MATEWACECLDMLHVSPSKELQVSGCCRQLELRCAGRASNRQDSHLATKNGDEGPDWMRGGSYIAVCRICFALEHCDHVPQAHQEEAVGEAKHPGMPDNKAGTESTVDDENAQTHLHIVAPRSQSMLRQSYSYNDGVNFTSERWPPWRQGLEYDAGMFFICYQRDPRTGFIEMYDKMAKYDSKLNSSGLTREADSLPTSTAPGRANTSANACSSPDERRTNRLHRNGNES